MNVARLWAVTVVVLAAGLVAIVLADKTVAIVVGSVFLGLAAYHALTALAVHRRDRQ